MARPNPFVLVVVAGLIVAGLIVCGGVAMVVMLTQAQAGA